MTEVRAKGSISQNTDLSSWIETTGPHGIADTRFARLLEVLPLRQKKPWKHPAPRSFDASYHDVLYIIAGDVFREN